MKNRFFDRGCHISLFILIIIISLFYIITSVHAKEVRGVTDTTVKLGVIGDLTGPAADTWRPLADAIKIYYKYINDQGGIHGRKINYVLEDDRYSIPMAMAAFKKLVFRDKILSLTPGASGAGHTHVLIPLCEKHKVPLSAATNNKDFFQPVRKYVFTTLPFYSDQIKLMFEYLLTDLKIENPRISLAYPDTAAGKDVRDSVQEEARASNIKLLSEVILPLMGGDCSSQVLNLKRAKPDYIIIYGHVAGAVSFLRDAKKLSLSAVSFITQYGCVEDTVKIAGDAAGNMMGANGFGSWHDNSPGMNKIRKVTLKYYPGSGSRNRNFMQGWFIAMTAVEALKNAGRNLNDETLIDGYEKIRGFDTQGICGFIDFGPKDHKAIDYHRIYKADVENKKLIPITEWRKPYARD
ncbi:MAG: ABC transporter substrate-binding protein [Thermodesulfobacteriota bacterium]|nr:ABC transporter substrate-binding protein [Thermodesulfobacteriota bacterium]